MHGRVLKVHLILTPSLEICFDWLSNSLTDEIIVSAGKSAEQAMNDYITKVKQLFEESGVSCWLQGVIVYKLLVMYV